MKRRCLGIMVVLLLICTNSTAASIIPQPEMVYYNQGDYPGEMIGTSTIRAAGCAPCAMAVCISSFTGKRVSVPKLCQWAEENGYYYSGSGSSHYIVPALAKKYGLSCQGIGYDREKMLEALYSGKYVVALMGSGTFAISGHFIVLTGINNAGWVSIADVGSRANTYRTYPVRRIMEELKDYSQADGPMWVISTKEEQEIKGASKVAITTLTQRFAKNRN